MKKLLSILAAVGLTATTGITVVACSNEPKNDGEETPKKDTIEISTDQSTLKIGETIKVNINLNEVNVDGFTPEVQYDKEFVSVELDSEVKSFKVTGLAEGETEVYVVWTKEDEGETFAEAKTIESNKITLTIEGEKDPNKESIEGIIKFPNIEDGNDFPLFSGEGLTADNVIAEVLTFAQIDGELTVDDLELADNGFYPVGKYANGQATITAKKDSNFEGQIKVTLYHPEFIAKVETLRKAETKSDDKMAAWIDYVDFRWKVVEEDLAAGRIIALLKTEIINIEHAFKNWVSENFISGLQELTKSLGVEVDYEPNGYRHNKINVEVDKPEKGIITYSATWKMTFWEGKYHEWFMETPWEIPYQEI